MTKVYYKLSESTPWHLDSEFSDSKEDTNRMKQAVFHLVLDGYIVKIEEE
jgi:hypothetical protein